MAKRSRSVWQASSWLLVLAAVVAPTAAEAQVVYEYIDEFGMELAQLHCFESSPFEETHPDIAMEGYLIYELSPCGMVQLGFYGGFLVDSDAYLTYRFPLDGEGFQIESGTMSFSVCQGWQSAGSMRVQVFFEGTSGGFDESFSSPGYYERGISPGDSADAVYIRFIGSGVFLMSLEVTLYLSTPVERMGWGQIKSMFR